MPPLFKESNIRKLPNKIGLKKSPPTMSESWFTLSADSHAYNTCLSNLDCLVLIPNKTKLYGRNSLLVVSTHGIVYKN